MAEKIPKRSSDHALSRWARAVLKRLARKQDRARAARDPDQPARRMYTGKAG